MREVLRNVAGEPMLATSGPDALRLVELHRFAVVLLDVPDDVVRPLAPAGLRAARAARPLAEALP